MVFIEPEEGALEAFLAQFPEDRPVFMLNLLRFSEQAHYPDGQEAEPCSGPEAYMRYGEGVRPLLEAAGGEQVWMGRQAAMVIGPQDKDWSLVVLVRYPNAQAFVNMVSSAEYQAVSFHRSAALDDSRLIALDEF